MVEQEACVRAPAAAAATRDLQQQQQLTRVRRDWCNADTAADADMSDFLKSALSNLSAAWNVTLNPDTRSGSPSAAVDNALIGQVVEVKGRRIRIERLVAEGESASPSPPPPTPTSHVVAGGFGFVFKVRDLETGHVLALKRLVAADREAKEEIECEVSVLQQLQPHPHILHFVAFGVVHKNVYLLLRSVCRSLSLSP